MDSKQITRIHHFIPQFILKHFSINEKVFYWNLDKQKLTKRKYKCIFNTLDMYKDETNHPDDPTIIETALAEFENEVSKIIDIKILGNDTISLTRKELESIRIFLTLLSFRSQSRKNQFENKIFDEQTQKELMKFTKNDDFLDLWKRDLYELSKIRTYNELIENKIIDELTKKEFLDDYENYYMTIIESSKEDFLLTDLYPVCEMYPTLDGYGYPMHIIYPVSNTKAILLHDKLFKNETNVSDLNYRKLYLQSRIKGNLIRQPKVKYKQVGTSEYDIFTYKTVKINSNDIQYLNSLSLNEATNGVIFKIKNNIKDSVHYYNTINNLKNDLKTLERILIKKETK